MYAANFERAKAQEARGERRAARGCAWGRVRRGRRTGARAAGAAECARCRAQSSRSRSESCSDCPSRSRTRRTQQPQSPRHSNPIPLHRNIQQWLRYAAGKSTWVQYSVVVLRVYTVQYIIYSRDGLRRR